MEKLIMTPADIQQVMGVSKNTAYTLINRADFPKIHVGRKILIPRDAFLRWLEAQTKQAAG